jgi:predicted DNA-binding protein
VVKAAAEKALKKVKKGDNKKARAVAKKIAKKAA